MTRHKISPFARFPLAGILPGALALCASAADAATETVVYSFELGKVFSIDLSTGTETVLHSFVSNKHHGANPAGGLVEAKGKLYGTTAYGGKYRSGTAFSIDLKTGKEKIVYAFCSQTGCADGANPAAGLLKVNGTLYGVT
jgi:uncharacterized repeat protein (TIGR03803 family)